MSDTPVTKQGPYVVLTGVTAYRPDEAIEVALEMIRVAKEMKNAAV